VPSSRNLRATKEVTEPVKTNVKKTASKTNKKTALRDDDDFDLSDAFDEDDNDFDIIDVSPVKPVKAASKKVVKAVQKSSPVKARPIPAPKPAPKSALKASPSTPAAKPTTKPAASTGAGLTSDDILKNIPDAILPEVDSSKKFNYFALKAAKDSAAQPSGDLVIPQARENCLAGMTFVFTGNLPRLPREEGQDIVKKYGGKVTTSPSSKTTCVVLGAEAGPSKIEKIKKFGIKAIDEDGFLQLLSEMPADGGSGAAAQKAILKQKEEQKRVEIVVKEMSKDVGSKDKSKTGNGNGDLWTTKYAPSELSHICGNKGLVEKLGRWLRAWRSNAKKGFKSAGPDGSGIYRSVIISGPPGIGKTTAAHLVAKLNGFDVIESNASDTRSKNMLISKVMGSTKNTSLSGFLSNVPQDASKKNICLVMDEVDGMSGGDRGGVGQMAALCRTTNVPIILICNERSLPKMRPFDRVALDMQFRRPDANALRIRIMGIANKEGIRVTPQVVDQLVSSSGSDMRQIINLLYTYSRTHKKMDFQTSQDFSKAFEKSITLKPFDITAKLLSGGTFAPNSSLSLDDKIRLYFDDHDFTPLMIQENYLNTHPSSVNNGKFKNHLDAVVAASESISDGDLVDKRIHGSQPQWSLMPFHGVMSSVLPSSYVAGQGRGRYNFTTYLGQNSKTNKYARLLQEIQSHARLKISGDKKEVRLQYLPLLSSRLIKPLLSNGDGGINEVIEVMDEYFLTKEDWDVIMELGVGPLSNEAKAKGLPTAVKSAFTRNYNKVSHPVPFMKSSSMFSAKATAAAMPTEVPDLEETVGEEVPITEDDADDKDKDEDEDLSKDKYIKVSKPKASAKRGTKKAATATGGSGKAKTARGKGRASTR
jgi:replication factor C subunit 1